MPTRDPFSFQKRSRRFPNLRQTLDKQQNKPYIGVTQGGSSRKDAGARVAATTGNYKKPRK